MVHFAHVAGFDDDADLHAVLGADEVVVYAGEHQERRDGRQVAVRVAVAQHDELCACLDRLVDFVAEFGDPFLHGVRTGVCPVKAFERRRQPAAGPGVDVLDLGELVVVDDREVEDDLSRVLGAGGQEVALRAEAQLERGHDLFADGVERRVRHLGELLGEVVEQQSRTLGQHRDRCVGAHGSQGLGAGLRHRAEEDAHFFLGVAERALATGHRRGRVDDVLAFGEVFEVDPALVEPFAPRFARRELCFDLVVFDETPRDGVDEEHLSRAKSALAHDTARVDVEHADLARQNDESVSRDHIPAGAQAVAVEGCADEGSVGEHDRSRAVPRLHEHRVVLVEVAADRIDLGLVLPGLRDHHHHGVRQRAAGKGQQLHHLVERGRIARAGRDDGEHRSQVAQQGAFELRLTRAHPVAVALHRVDLAVVGDHAERLGKRPGREGVRRIARVHEGELRRETLVGEVGVERLQLERRDHALVDERAARQRREVHVELALDTLAGTERLAVEQDAADRRPGLARARAGDEQLFDRRHGVACEGSDLVGSHRNVAPPDDHEVLVDGDRFDRSLHGGTFFGCCRKERVADGVTADRRKLESGDRAQERIRDLRDDACSVTGAGVGAHRPAVLEVAQRVERRIDDVVAGSAAQRRHHGETAGVLLESGVVETLLGGKRAEAGGLRA